MPGRKAHDPYGDFVVRVMNSCRIALTKAGGMSDDELKTVEDIRNLLIKLDPASTQVQIHSIAVGPAKQPQGSERGY